MRSPVVIFFVAFIALFVFVKEIPAQVYKYVDKDGVIHFTDTPTDPKYKSGRQGAGAESGYQNAFVEIKMRIKNLSDKIMNNPSKYNTIEHYSVAEMLSIVESAIPTGTKADREFIEIVDRFIERVESHRAVTRELNFLVDRARTARMIPVESRPTPGPVHLSPPPIVNVFK